MRPHRESADATGDRLRTLLRAADDDVEVPPDLFDRIRRPRPTPAAPPAARRRRLRPLLAAGAVAVVAAGAALLAGTGGLHLFHRQSAQAPPGGTGITVTVYNAEAGCRPLHTLECALDLLQNPHERYVAQYSAGLVWHGERLSADCVVTDGTLLTDEAGVSSRRWYHVTLPTGATGWLPGARTRNTEEVPFCATDPALPPDTLPGPTSSP